MNLEELYSTYVLCDGEIHSFKLDFNYLSFGDTKQTDAIIELKVCKKLARKRFEYCLIELHFQQVVKFFLYEDFESSINYSDITFKNLENGLLYFSCDPYGNSNEPNEQDNFVIVAKSFQIKERIKTNNNSQH